MSFHCYNGSNLHCSEILVSSTVCLHSPNEEAKHWMILAVNHPSFSAVRAASGYRGPRSNNTVIVADLQKHNNIMDEWGLDY